MVGLIATDSNQQHGATLHQAAAAVPGAWSDEANCTTDSTAVLEALMAADRVPLRGVGAAA